jgi:hypothetical protein
MREAGTISIRLRGGRNGFSSLYLRTTLDRWSCLRGNAWLQPQFADKDEGCDVLCMWDLMVLLRYPFSLFV